MIEEARQGPALGDAERRARQVSFGRPRASSGTRLPARRWYDLHPELVVMTRAESRALAEAMSAELAVIGAIHGNALPQGCTLATGRLVPALIEHWQECGRCGCSACRARGSHLQSLLAALLDEPGGERPAA